MLFTRESDYAIRIVRALKGGEQRNVDEICSLEEVPRAFCYKIMKKLGTAGIVDVARGAGGGYRLGRSLDDLTLYDIIAAIEPEFSVMECIHHFCSRNSGSNHCKVHRELLGIQSSVEKLLREKTLYDILEG
nr:Rrf2 family transcriptional regulator [uncultured Mediterraneibacter sp.]